jgi:hypothetical protein
MFIMVVMISYVDGPEQEALFEVEGQDDESCVWLLRVLQLPERLSHQSAIKGSVLQLCQPPGEYA